MVSLLLLELLTASLTFLILPVIVVILAVPDLFPVVLHWAPALTVHAAVAGHTSLRTIGLGVLLPDLLLTLVVAAVERRPQVSPLRPVLRLHADDRRGDRGLHAAARLAGKVERPVVSPARRDPTGGATIHPVGRRRERPAEPELTDARTSTVAAEAGDVEAQARLGRLFARTGPARPGQGAAVVDQGRRGWPHRIAERPGGAAGDRTGSAGTGRSAAVVDQGRRGRPHRGAVQPGGAAGDRAGSARAGRGRHVVDQGRRGRRHRGAEQPGGAARRPAGPAGAAEARTWYAKAAAAGDIRAQYGLGRLLATAMDPPELAEARTWWTQAAEAGHTESQYGSARLLADLHNPPELEGGSYLVHQGRRGRAHRGPVRPRGAACRADGPAGPGRGPRLVHQGRRGRAQRRPVQLGSARWRLSWPSRSWPRPTPARAWASGAGRARPG